jgi:Glyoxalase/Bleomycin resistance protein/Dioxygenase superfamily
VLFVFDEPGLKPGMMFNGALACDNMEQTYQELTAKGGEFVTPPTKQPWGMFAVFKDPDDKQFLLSTKLAGQPPRLKTRLTSSPNDGSLTVPPTLIGMKLPPPSFLKSGSTTLSSRPLMPPTVCDTFASISS